MKIRPRQLMAVSLCLLPMAVPAQTTTFPEPGTAPAWHIEENVNPDGTTSVQLVFETIPGVEYTVEQSHDLAQWSPVEGETHYGLGQTVVVPMVERPAPPDAPPPPDPPPAPQPKPVIAAMQLRPATGGGLIIRWRSLDDTSVRAKHFPLLELDPAWEYVILHAPMHEGHWFIAQHILSPGAPPVADPGEVLGPKDTAMLAAFEASFDEMNQAVHDSFVRARNAPPPAPPDPNAAKFLRIRADWWLDSDADRNPDWLEFAAQSPPQGGLGDALADPFSHDVNHNGTPDGLETDMDHDGVVDALDANPVDEAIDWQRTAPFRYAFFPVTRPPAAEGFPSLLLHANDRGEVLFTRGLWRAGNLVDLVPDSVASTHPDYRIHDCVPQGMNDAGQIVGIGMSNVLQPAGPPPQGTSASPPLAVAWWDSAEAAPVLVRDGDSIAEPVWDHPPLPGDDLPRDRFIDQDRRLVAKHPRPEPNTPPDHKVWQEPGETSTTIVDGTTYTFRDFLWTDTDDCHRFVLSPGLVWGPDGGQTKIGGKPAIAHWAPRLSHGPTGGLFAGGKWIGARWFHAASWQAVPRPTQAAELSAAGIFLSSPTELWVNHGSTDLPDLSPDLPHEWYKPGLCDITPRGWLLANKGDPDGPVGIAMPVTVVDAAEETGVDAFSCTSEFAHQAPIGNRVWIMAPIGSPNAFVLRAPASAISPLKVEHPDLLFTTVADPPEDDTTGSSLTLAEPEHVFAVSAPAGTESGAVVNPEFFLGGESGPQSLSRPFAVKAMKARTVRVSVHPICLPVAEGAPAQPSLLPAEAQLEGHLHNIFQPQINASISVHIEPQATLEWDVNGNHRLDVKQPSDPLLTEEQQDVVEAAAAAQSNFQPHIHIYVLAARDRDRVDATDGKGVSDPDRGMAWVLGNPVDLGLTVASVMDTIAHEIGHIFVGGGHPDEIATGVAPLPGTDHTRRLMCSGRIALSPRKRLLVKQEWDKAEVWMQQEVDSNNNQQ